MISELVTGVTPEQIAAATRIHDEFMPGWARTDRALTLLADSVPGLHPDAIALKAAAVDRLYNTRHYGLDDAIGRVIEVMARPPAEPIAFVEAIAPVTVGGKLRWHWSFASKFSHWFIDDGLPIHDYWAIRSVVSHFGLTRWTSTAYRDLAEHVYALREASSLFCTIREMDRYLWLSGMYRAWLGAEDRGKLGLSGEVAKLFESQGAGTRLQLAELLGEVAPP
jgi:hypothetical protein